MKDVLVKLANSLLYQLARLRLSGERPESPDATSLAVVCDLSRRNGISRGATLQLDAANKSGCETHLIDVSGLSPINFWKSASAKGSAVYVLHTGIPETSQLVHKVLPAASTLR